MNTPHLSCAGSLVRTLRTVIALAALGVALGVVAPVSAQQAPPEGMAPQMTPEQAAQIEAFQEKRTEFMRLQQELERIEQAALESNPELQQQRDAFGDLIVDEMKRQGHSPEEDIAELQSLQDRLSNAETPEEERPELMGKLQSKVMALEEAQQQALESPRVQEERGKLVAAITTAMQREDPRTNDIIQQMEKTQEELMTIHQSVMGEQVQ